MKLRMTESDCAVDAEDIGKRYGNGHQALDSVSFRVMRGTIFGLLGQNGAGKTTLIKILCGLLRPTTGRLKLLGQNALPRPNALKSKVGVVSQDMNLDFPLTVRQNLVFHCRYFAVPKAVAQRNIDEWLALFDLGDVANEPIHRLSGGNKRKVMIARAFITMPDLLILDEPTTALDPIVRAELWDKINAFATRGGTVLLSTHHFEEAETLCDQVGLIHAGILHIADSTNNLEHRLRTLVEANSDNLSSTAWEAGS